MVGNTPGVKSVDCGNCGSAITLRGLGQTLTIACSSCGSIADITDNQYKLITKSQKKTYWEEIPLGARGTIGDTKFEVIGFLVRTDNSGEWEWAEYLLFNPYQGFRWLVENQGHWSYVTPLKGAPPKGTKAVSLAFVEQDSRLIDLSFKHFLSDKAKVKYVMGEFYWEVRLGDTVWAADYISPPFMLSEERDGHEISWSLGEYMESEQVREAFPALKLSHWRSGVGANQPSPVDGYRQQILFMWGLFAVALTILQIIFSSLAVHNLVHFEQTLNYSLLDPNRTVTTQPFTVTGWGSNLEVSVFSAVENNWVDVGIDLVNAVTGETVSTNAEVSFYHGYESGENWVEGSRKTRQLIGSVPSGTYTLHLGAEGGLAQGTSLPVTDYSVRVTEDVRYLGNYGMALLFISLFPAYVLVRHWTFEASRWSNSDQA